MMICFTNGYQLVYKLVMLLGVFVALGAVFSIIDALPEEFFIGMPEWFEFVGGLGIFIATISIAPIVYSRTILPCWIPSWFYVRLNLGIKVDTSEASRVSFLFDGSIPGGVWYPLRGIRSLDKDLRREALFEFANRIAYSNRWGVPFPEYFFEQSRRQDNKEENETENNNYAGVARNDGLSSSFAILGLTEENSTWEDVKLAYRRKMRMYHPDKFGGEQPEVLRHAEDMSKKINYAYSLLEKHYNRGI